MIAVAPTLADSSETSVATMGGSYVTTPDGVQLYYKD